MMVLNWDITSEFVYKKWGTECDAIVYAVCCQTKGDSP